LKLTRKDLSELSWITHDLYIERVDYSFNGVD